MRYFVRSSQGRSNEDDQRPEREREENESGCRLNANSRPYIRQRAPRSLKRCSCCDWVWRMTNWRCLRVDIDSTHKNRLPFRAIVTRVLGTQKRKFCSARRLCAPGMHSDIGETCPRDCSGVSSSCPGVVEDQVLRITDPQRRLYRRFEHSGIPGRHNEPGPQDTFLEAAPDADRLEFPLGNLNVIAPRDRNRADSASSDKDDPR